MLVLDKNVKIILMDKDNNGNDLTELNEKAKMILSVAFGGVTITAGVGTWVDNNTLYEDDNHIYECGYAGALTQEQKDAFLEVINMEFEKGGQLAVSVYVNNTMVILDKSDMKQKAEQQSIFSF